MQFEYLVGGAAIIGLAYSFWKAREVASQTVTSQKAQEISTAIRVGAMAFLNREYRVLSIFILIAAIALWLLIGAKAVLPFVAGAFLSAVAGNIGMRIATIANVRTAEAVQKSLGRGLTTAFAAGSVVGMAIVSLGLLGIIILFKIYGNPEALFSFGFGASVVALFARVGGGIYTKAADVGADLVGKIEQGIPEDDPRNPATIADNVGDNVGDVAGMGADLFDSYIAALLAATALGFEASALYGTAGITYPFVIAAIGIIASIVGVFFVKTEDKNKIGAVMNRGIFAAGAIIIVGTWFATDAMFADAKLFWVVVIGLVAGILIGLSAEFFTSSSRKPAQRVAAAARTGAATNIISGLALGMFSTGFPILIMAATILITHELAGFYGIAIAVVGMLSTLGITLASDTYGPVADNAAGIAEMAGLGKETRERAEALDAVGNTTAAIGKGFATGSAALTAIALFISYVTLAGIKGIDITQPYVMAGLLVGGMVPFIFSALAMKAVGQAAMGMVEEVRRQFREIPGLLAGTGKPDYSRAVDIATQSALREMMLPTILGVLAPVVIGFVFGAEALGGMVAGTIVVGFLLSISQANSGGAWDNAKKYIEAGNLGGKGSDIHKAAVVGDTVGDPFKDTSGPSLNILIKLVSMVSLIIAPLL
ncbi:MAG: sodium-translocating pyrophosphatase [Candidatus Andersenbacteria bacterium]|nr:sodium-translocating pyrophosphatase [Candidatus Andersenbacteria bacterium]MBI3250681.1 sodium-translocating pyrophosphatase [Candidatus Andersenbacteria bacterium]